MISSWQRSINEFGARLYDSQFLIHRRCDTGLHVTLTICVGNAAGNKTAHTRQVQACTD